MITFKKKENLLIAIYTTKQEDINWLFERLEDGGSYTFQKTFNFGEKDLVSPIPEKDINHIFFPEVEPVEFIFAKLEKSYFKVTLGVLMERYDVYLSKDLEFTAEMFVAESDISIFSKINKLIEEDIYLGGSNENAIAESEFIQLINGFPNAYEKKLYADAKISNLLKEYFSTNKDIDLKFQKYLNKKQTIKGTDLEKTFKEIEIIKYQTISDKLDGMLSSEANYSEKQWQKEILQIILFLYPKYIAVFENVPVKADEIKEKFLDFLLVDANGNTDIIEIKKPFESSIVTKGLYRDNHIPLRELSGTIMQIEKYVYYLNRWSLKGENFLTAKYKADLPENFEIKITNPGALIIMGRENNLSIDQKRDFEVVKRKYKNVIDIITYDNLFSRLKFTIEQMKKI